MLRSIVKEGESSAVVAVVLVMLIEYLRSLQYYVPEESP